MSKKWTSYSGDKINCKLYLFGRFIDWVYYIKNRSILLIQS